MSPPGGGFGTPGMPGAPTSPGNPLGGPGSRLPDSPDGEPTPVDPTSWSVWWQFNRHPYLEVDRFLAGLDTHSGSNSCLDENTIKRQVLPFVENILRKGADFKIMRNGLLAVARMNRAGLETKLPLSEYVGFYLRDQYPELQEAGLLALGVNGDVKDLDTLDSLLRDNEAGRKLMDGRPVPVRLRSYAAYSMGLIAERNESEEVRRKVVHSLYFALGNERTATREVQVACVLAAGLAPMGHGGNDPEKLAIHRMEGDRHMCGGVQMRYLLDILRDKELDSWMRAHAAPAIGRLGLAAPDDFKVAAIEEFEKIIDAKSDEEEAVRHGAILGLGLVADGDDDELDVRARKALEKAMKRADPLGQRRALIGLARAGSRVGGDDEAKGLADAQAKLLRELSRGRGEDKAWASLALAVLGHGRLENRRAVPEDVRMALRRTVSRAKSADVQAASSLALAVLRDPESGDVLEKLFKKADDSSVRANAALGLGVIGARDKKAALREAFEDEDVETPEYCDLAIGLRLLGDRKVIDGLVERLKEAGENLAVAKKEMLLPEEERAKRAKEREKAKEDELLSVEEYELEQRLLVATLGRLEDPSALPHLMAILTDETGDDAVRGQAMAAVGGMCDSEPITWFEPFATDVNYSVLTWGLTSPSGDGTGIFEMF